MHELIQIATPALEIDRYTKCIQPLKERASPIRLQFKEVIMLAFFCSALNSAAWHVSQLAALDAVSIEPSVPTFSGIAVWATRTLSSLSKNGLTAFARS